MEVDRECTFMSSWELLPQLLCAAKSLIRQVYPFIIMHNHTGLASHQKSVIYIVFSNKMSNEFCFFIFIIL